MSRMESLKVFLSERLTAAAEEIFGAVEKTIVEYKEEVSRSKDLEISRLRMQLKLLKSEPQADRYVEAQLQQEQHHMHQHPPPPPPPPPQHQHQPAAAAAAVEATDSQQCEEDGSSSISSSSISSIMEQPELSEVKKEQQKSHRDFWMSHDAEQMERLESDIKEFISSSPSSLKSSLHDPVLPFHPYHHHHHHHHSNIFNINSGSGGSGGEDGKEKPYSCSACEKRFSNCSHLAAHIRTHTGERPYRCDICRKTFVTTSALNRHQTIHTEGKHFICNYCGKSFKWMESLGRHVRVVHVGRERENVPV